MIITIDDDDYDSDDVHKEEDDVIRSVNDWMGIYSMLFFFVFWTIVPCLFCRSPIEIYEGIVTGNFKNPRHFSSNLRDFVKSLLQTDLTRWVKKGV